MIAYLIGWKRADSYFTSFGGGWVATEMSMPTLMSLSYWPLIIFAFGTLTTFSDLADRYNKSIKALWVVSVIAFVTTLFAAFWSQWKGDYAGAASSFHIHLLPVAMILGLRFGEIALELSSKDFQWHSSNIWTICFLFFWFFNSVSLLGSSEGKRDADPMYSRLDVIETKDGRLLRLLFAKEGTVYATLLSNGLGPKITILGREDVQYIFKPRKPKKSSKQ